MLRNVYLKTLRDRRRSLVGWAIGIAAFNAFSVAFWPSVRDSAAEFRELIQNLPESIRSLVGVSALDITTPEGYLNGRVFALVVPLLFLIFAVGFGSRTVAGEEQRGTLELVLAAPIARWRVVLEKFAALATATAFLGLVLWVTLVVVGGSVDLGVAAGSMAGPVVMAFLLAISFGALALGIGCATGRRSWASGIATGLAVAAYLVKALAPVSEEVESFQGLSPFYYYDAAQPLVNGIDMGHAAFFLLVVLAFVGLALVMFDRRDVGL